VPDETGAARRALDARGAPRRPAAAALLSGVLSMARPPAQVYQIHVTLNDTRPPIWRRLQVPGNTTLRKLHDILQIAMGWTDSHLHQFIAGDRHYGAVEYDDGGELELLPEHHYRLSHIAQGAGARFAYEYDFGDSWRHTLVVERIHPPEPGVTYPLCLAGERACPPEDVGGVGGYAEFLKAIRSPRHPEHDMYREWIGGDFDPDAFDLEAVNARLRRMGRGRSAELASTWVLIEQELEGRQTSLESAWARTLSGEDRATAESLPLRRDMLTLLTYLRDERVTGTQAIGNLPLNAVRAICARFASPPKLEDVIGGEVYPVRSETAVWPLYFLHLLAAIAGLVTGGPARRWRLTPSGEQFLAAEAPAQVWLLSATWWTRVNWAIASPWPYAGGRLPYDFTALTRERLLALPAGEWVPFEPFAGRLVAEGGLVWPTRDQEAAQGILKGLVARVVIAPLRDFGVLAAEYGPHPLLGPRYPELVAIRLTPFGKGLLAATREATR
jgi:hypothetical protein